VSVEELLKQACDKLRDSKRILLTSHRRPDGDGTGSMSGLASLLRAQGKEAVIYSVDPIARRYKWLPLVPTVVHTMSFDERFDCTIVVDCADISLLGDTLPPPEVCGTLITLDHHASGKPFGDIAVWDASAAAVGVLVHRIAVAEGWPLTVEAAVPLYVSLISDTGGFRHANTNAEALHVASELIRAGVVPATIAASLEERPSPGKLRLLGSVLSTLELHCAGRAGFLSVTTDMVEGARASWEDIEGMVNWARNAEGVQVGVLLTAAKGGGVRVSMRSRSDKVDVGKVCMTLGGGGHPGAGGCHVSGDLVTSKDKVVKALEAAFNRISRPVMATT
jgi:phosphoesterase RecJ-like protein